MVQARQGHAAEAVGSQRQRFRAVGDLVDRPAFDAELAHGDLDLVGGVAGVGAGLPQGLERFARIACHGRNGSQRGIEALLHGGIEPLHERVRAARGLREVVQRQADALLVLVAQQVVDAVGGLLHLREDGGALLRELAERRALERQARQATGAAGHRRLRGRAVVEQHVG